ncbi:MAG TPA: UDP-N-acetylmuramoyl-L-alanyl-D-glutamate--2,6-diaminopimelate ligase [Alphaproteobacteria bacterium]
MRLSELTDIAAGSPDPDIAGLTHDSRQVRNGWLFAALPGSKADGRDYIHEAVARGAVAVLTAKGIAAEAAVNVASDNPRRDFSLMAAKFYSAQPRVIAAVTGTNGKTSTVHFTQQLWQSAGFKAVGIGTLGVSGAVAKTGSMTTPDPVSLHAELADLTRAGVTHVAMEASSHGLDQHRLDGVRVTAAGFTNLTRDHLDYHGTMEDYRAAKARLFDILDPDGVAVLNADAPEFNSLKTICTGRGIRVIGYGGKGADLWLTSRKAIPQGQEAEIEFFGQREKLAVPLVGSFMLMNALCAYGLAGIDRPRDLEKLQNAPGRLQLVGRTRGAAVYVDYAHTPDALENVLDALRPHTAGRLICMFGCGGDRDPGKRPIMGGISAAKADLTVITDDNPRTEKPEAIRDAIRHGAGMSAKIIGGRREAIQWSVAQLKPGDVLVLAGKGHEQGQIFADHVEPFDDVEEAKIAIKGLKGAA